MDEATRPSDYEQFSMWHEGQTRLW